jgi:hypothetical protein
MEESDSHDIPKTKAQDGIDRGLKKKGSKIDFPVRSSKAGRIWSTPYIQYQKPNNRPQMSFNFKAKIIRCDYIFVGGMNGMLLFCLKICGYDQL